VAPEVFQVKQIVIKPLVLLPATKCKEKFLLQKLIMALILRRIVAFYETHYCVHKDLLLSTTSTPI
jgi:hypothetical protein